MQWQTSGAMKTYFDRQEGKDEWLTPPEIFRPLQPFDLDVAEPINPPWHIGNKGFNINDNGLAQEWEGFVWCNPPYGNEAKKWLAKMKQHNNGIALVFARTDTRMFHEYVFSADAILFLNRRLSFYTIQGIQYNNKAGAPTCLVAYGSEAVSRLQKSGIKGKLILL